MGNDGGSIPDRRDLVRTKAKAEQADKANQTRARWFFCALSKRPLREPLVACELGKLYNLDALLEFLLNRAAFGDGQEICGHVRSRKDVTQLTLAPNTAPKADENGGAERALAVCPLTFKEMTGAVPFVYLARCGCVFSQAGLRAVSSPSSATPDKEQDGETEGAGAGELDVCPQCATKYNRAEDVRLINPGPEEEERMRTAMERRRAGGKGKGKGKGKKRKAAAEEEEGAPAAKRKAAGNGPTVALGARREVASKLAAEEAKRKAEMSDAVRSLYRTKDGPERKETFMTMGTFTRYA
ncbi:Rtf2 RING-finger-domain-containing protein [Gloeopeniophorella convolvens]|nr:Rtf2 RING-finger-domain-containing protein [Gloeopeniophorella convolvens]